MKKMMRAGMFVLLTMALAAGSFAQERLSRSELESRVAQLEEEVQSLRANDEELRIEELESRLEELKQVDKGSLTAEEKKAWKKEKRAISNELADLKGNDWNSYYNRYPYGRFGWYGWGNPYRFSRFLYRRPVYVIVRPRATTT